MARFKNPSEPDTKSIFEKGILSRNPVLVYAIGICPLIAVAKSAATAAVLAVLSAILLIFLEILTALIFKKMPKWLRVGVYAVIGVLLIIPFYMLMSAYMPSIEVSLGIYIPLLAVNSITVQRCEAFAVKHSVKSAFLDALANSIGYAIPLILTGMIREALGSSKIFGHYIDALPHANGFLMPFCGFIILGFVAAFINYMRSTFRIGDEFDTKDSDFIIDKQKNKDSLSNDEDSLQNEIDVIPDNIPEPVKSEEIPLDSAESKDSEDNDPSANFESSVSRIMHKWSPVSSAEISDEISPTAEAASLDENKKETDTLSESNIHNTTVSEGVSTEESANKEESAAPKKTTRKRTTKKATAPTDVNTETAVSAESSENKEAAADTTASTDTVENAAPKKATRKRTTKKTAAPADVNTETAVSTENSESKEAATDTATASTDTAENSAPKKTTRKRTTKKTTATADAKAETVVSAESSESKEAAADTATASTDTAENAAPKKTTRKRTTSKNTEASTAAKKSAPKED